MSEEEKDKDNDKPLFLQAQDPATWDKPEEVSWGDHFLAPHRPLNQRQKRLAEMLFEGKRTQDIAKELNYTQPRVSVLKTNSKIMAEVERLRDKAFERTIDERMKDLGPMAMDALEELLMDPNVPITKKEGVAKWVVEMRAGKASQKIDVSGEITIGHFMDKLDTLPTKNVTPQMLPESENSNGEAIDTESQEPEKDFAASWLDENL